MTRSRLPLFITSLLVVAGSTLVIPTVWERSCAHATPAAAPPAVSQPAATPPATPSVAPAPSVAARAAGAAPALSTAISQAAAAISPSVVQIQVQARAPGERAMGPFVVPRGDRLVEGSGSGVVLRADGYVLTNNHVVENAVRIDVRLQDGRRYAARLVGIDSAIDLAVLKIEATGLTPARFADSDHALVGQWVVAVGAPFGLDYTVTAGVLSATGRGNLGANEIEDYLQTDASINPGNSGGPLVDLEGAVIGINTMIIGRGTGIGFAIPSDLARHVAEQIMANGRVHRAWLGVSFQEMSPELATYFAPDDRRGALVNGVVADGPAARAGLRPGDVILALGGENIADGHDLLRKLLRRPVGERLPLAVLRDGRPQNLTITTAERPGSAPTAPRASAPAAPTNGIGLAVDTLDSFLRQRLRYSGPGTIVVRDVVPGSASDRAGLRPGDVIVELDRQTIRNVDDMKAQLRDGRALVDAARGDHRFYTVIEGTPIP